MGRNQISSGDLVGNELANKKGLLTEFCIFKTEGVTDFFPKKKLERAPYLNFYWFKMVLGKKLWGLLGLELSGELKNVVQMTVSLKLRVLENSFPKGNIGKKKIL